MIGNQSEVRIKVGAVYEKVGSITNVGPLQRSRDVIDVTTYDSPAIEKELTLEDNGDIELTFNYRENDDSQKLFETKFSENAILDFEFYLPDSRGTSKRFKGGIMQFSLEVPNKETVTVSSSISVSGGYTTLRSGVGRAKFSNSTNNEIILKPKTRVTKVISGITYGYRTIAQITIPAEGNVDADIIGMNAGRAGNLPNNTTLSTLTSGVSCRTVGVLTGGSDA